MAVSGDGPRYTTISTALLGYGMLVALDTCVCRSIYSVNQANT